MKILYVTTISLTMNSFFKPHIGMLIKEGNSVDIACNFADMPADEEYSRMGCTSHHIDFSRNPLSMDNVKAYKQLKKVVTEGKYDIVHCHTPNASFITRLVCKNFRKNMGLKVYYTSHGFHFYRGAPILNWVVFYPAEVLCSYFTDKLITINNEDYLLAKNKLKAKENFYVPGVGIDIGKFSDDNNTIKRDTLGLLEDDFVILSAGELNENKNHQIVIKAMAKLNNPNIHYVIAGEGDKREYLEDLAKSLGVGENLHFLGYRKDLPMIYRACDIFCFPSIREGLGLAAIEAMICGLPVVAAENRGTRTFIKNGKNGFLAKHDSVEDFENAIDVLIKDKELREAMALEAQNSTDDYVIENILEKLKKVYEIH